jgi:hypothetical protein
MMNFDETPVQFATGLHVTAEQGAFQLVFWQFLQPIVATPADFEPLREQGFVPARVLTRIVLTPQVLEDAIEALRQQLQRAASRVEENNSPTLEEME